MGTIVKSKNAPEGDVTVSISTETFTVGADGEYKTDDLALLESAASHPFLKVDFGSPEAAETPALETLEPDRVTLKSEEKRAERNVEKAPTDKVAVPPQPEGQDPVVGVQPEKPRDDKS